MNRHGDGPFEEPDPSLVVAVLIVNYFSASLCAGLLRSLVGQTGVALHISIVDNSMQDDEWAKLELIRDRFLTEFSSVTMTRSPTNCGYGVGNNLAFDVLPVSPQVVVVANPDTILSAGSLRDLAVDSLANARPIAVRTVEDGEPDDGIGFLNLWSGQAAKSASPRRSQLAYAGGHFFALVATKWKQVGGFSEDLFLYCEEIDLALRLGTEMGTVPVSRSCQVSHVGAATTKSNRETSDFATFHANRSRAILYRKHRRLRPYLYWMALARLVLAGSYLVRRNPRRAASIVRGLLEGLGVR